MTSKEKPMDNIITSEYDRQKLQAAYENLSYVYEYNIGSKDPADRKLCKKLEKMLKPLSEILGKDFTPGCTI